jgi:dienelactone hydrolase
MILELIRRAGLALTVAGALATAAAVPSQAAVAAPARANPSQVTIQTVLVPVPGEVPVPAYLVRPAGALPVHSQAGILFLHWLGQIHSDRTEFLAEATELASRGAVSLLPQGKFPWVAAPKGTAHDVTMVRAQLAAFRACLHWLAARGYVDQHRVAIAGHDYGAMYGALLAGSSPVVHAAVLAAPDANWGHWFVKYWLGFKGKKALRYKALFTSLQPARHVTRLARHELFQWAGQDIYVSARVRHVFATRAPRAQVKLYQDSDHQLTDQAQADRDAFLARQLGLAAGD